MYKDNIPGFDGEMLIESLYDNTDVHLMEINCKKVLEPKMLGLFFLLEMYS